MDQGQLPSINLNLLPSYNDKLDSKYSLPQQPNLSLSQRHTCSISKRFAFKAVLPSPNIMMKLYWAIFAVMTGLTMASPMGNQPDLPRALAPDCLPSGSSLF